MSDLKAFAIALAFTVLFAIFLGASYLIDEGNRLIELEKLEKKENCK